MLAGAAVAGLLLLMFLSAALMYVLDNWMPVEFAAFRSSPPLAGGRARRWQRQAGRP